MHVSYNQLKSLALYIEKSVMAGPPPGSAIDMHPQMVMGIQTGALLAIQLLAIAAAIAAEIPITQAQQDFKIPPTIAERARGTLVTAVRDIMAGGTGDAPKANEFLQEPPADANSTETAGFKKFSNFMVALRSGVEIAYKEMAEVNTGEDSLHLPTELEESTFRNGMDFMIGSIAIALHDLTKKDVRTCAESIGIPERVIVDLEESCREDEAEADA